MSSELDYLELRKYAIIRSHTINQTQNSYPQRNGSNSICRMAASCRVTSQDFSAWICYG